MMKFFKTPSIWMPIVFALMDLAGRIGNIGFTLYYPLLLILALISLKHRSRTDGIFGFYLLACGISILFNNIPSFYNIYVRLVVYILLFVAFTPFVNSRYISVLRMRSIQYFCFFTVFIVGINFAFFKGGNISAAQQQIYQNVGMYVGSTGNNEMGALGAISLAYLAGLLMYWKQILNKIWIAVIGLFMVSNVAMLLMASSRSAVFCAFAAVISMIYVKNKRNLGSFASILLGLFFLIFALYPFFSEYTRGIIEFKQGGNLSDFDTHSRDAIWALRMEEFKSSPFWGIGFGTISDYNSWTIASGGTVETGSSWLAALSQTGLLGTIPIVWIVGGNLKWLLFSKKGHDYLTVLLTGLTVFFTIHPISEGYFTTVGAILCVLFWTIQGLVYSLRKGFFKTSDIPLLVIGQRKFRLF